jgi:hypothetical protein
MQGIVDIPLEEATRTWWGMMIHGNCSSPLERSSM